MDLLPQEGKLKTLNETQCLAGMLQAVKLGTSHLRPLQWKRYNIVRGPTC